MASTTTGTLPSMMSESFHEEMKMKTSPPIENNSLPHGLGHGVDQRVAHHAEVGGNAVAERAGALLLEEGHRQAHEVVEEIPAQAVQRGLAGADEALDAEKRDEGLQREHRHRA